MCAALNDNNLDLSAIDRTMEHVLAKVIEPPPAGFLDDSDNPSSDPESLLPPDRSVLNSRPSPLNSRCSTLNSRPQSRYGKYEAHTGERIPNDRVLMITTCPLTYQQATTTHDKRKWKIVMDKGFETCPENRV